MDIREAYPYMVIIDFVEFTAFLSCSSTC